MIFNYLKHISFILITFSGFYLAKLTMYSPIYFCFLYSFIIFFVGNLLNKNFEIKSISIAPLFFIFYLLFTQIFKNPDLNTFFNVLFSYSYLFLILNALNHIKTKEILTYSKIFVFFSITIFLLEAIWRLSHPVFLLNRTNYNNIQQENIVFYAYKASSIMFKDSNFVASYILLVYFFYVYLLKEKLVIKKFPIYILIILLLITLSRSAIFTVPLTYFFILLIKDNSIIKKCIFLFLFFFLISLIFKFESNDISFTSKIKIVSLTLSYINESNLFQLLTGVGFGNASKYLGIGAHNLYITYFVESGFIGLIFFLSICLYFLIKTNGSVSYILIPLFISGFSLSSHSLPFFFSMLTIIYFITINHGTNINSHSNI